MNPHVITRFVSPVFLKIGSSRTVVVGANKKVLLDEPARVAVTSESKSVYCVGEEAAQLEKFVSQEFDVSQLFFRGEFVDTAMCSAYLSSVFSRVSHSTRHLFFPLPVICVVPVSFPRSYQDLLFESLRQAHFLPLAVYPEIVGDARQGLGQKFTQQTTLTIRVGGSLTQVALMIGSTIVHAARIPWGGIDIDQAVGAHLFSRYGILPTQRAVSELKELYTRAVQSGAPFSAVVRGKDIRLGTAASIQCTGEDMHEVATVFFSKLAAQIGYAVRSYTDLFSQSAAPTPIFVSGGCSQFEELSTALTQVFGVSPTAVSRPHVASVLGVVHAYEQKEI